MKKFLFTIAFIFLSLLSADARKLGELSLELAGSYSVADSDYGPDKGGIHVLYMFNTSDKFQFGFGTGISYNNVRMNERHLLYQKNPSGPIEEVENLVPYQARKNAVAVPLFAKMKLFFAPNLPFRPFAALKAGTRIAQLKGISDNQLNPFFLEVTPALGMDFPVGKHYVGLEIGADYNMVNVDNQYWLKKKIVEDRPEYNTLFYKNELQKKSVLGVYAALTFTF